MHFTKRLILPNFGCTQGGHLPLSWSVLTSWLIQPSSCDQCRYVVGAEINPESLGLVSWITYKSPISVAAREPRAAIGSEMRFSDTKVMQIVVNAGDEPGRWDLSSRRRASHRPVFTGTIRMSWIPGYFSLHTVGHQCATGAQGCSGKGCVLLTALHWCQERGEAFHPHCIWCKLILE